MEIAVVGGDLRNKLLIEELTGAGVRCDGYLLGQEKTDGFDLSKYDAIIGPMPFSRDGAHLYTPLCDQRIRVADFFGCIREGATLFAGTIDKTVKIDCRYIDLTKDERFYDSVVAATTEGILQIILNSIDYTVSGASVLVLGYGKVGAPLSHSLRSLGASVGVYTIDVNEIEAARGLYDLALISDLSPYDIIVNTIPAIVIGDANIGTIRRGTLVLDIASAPGGIDVGCAEKHSVAYQVAPGLPGKKAPRTLARAMLRVVLERLGL